MQMRLQIFVPLSDYYCRLFEVGQTAVFYCARGRSAKTRYSGHQKSRLMQTRPNKSKQMPFPTSWKKAERTWSNEAPATLCQGFSRLVTKFWKAWSDSEWLRPLRRTHSLRARRCVQRKVESDSEWSRPLRWTHSLRTDGEYTGKLKVTRSGWDPWGEPIRWERTASTNKIPSGLLEGWVRFISVGPLVERLVPLVSIYWCIRLTEWTGLNLGCLWITCGFFKIHEYHMMTGTVLL